MTHITQGDHRSPAPSFTSPLDLPFVADLKVSPRRRERSWWATPPATDYGQACDAGREFGAEFVRYLAQDPRSAHSGLIGRIAQQMYGGVREPIPESGYAVGFWHFVGVMLVQAARHIDPQDINDCISRLYARDDQSNNNKGA